MAIVMRPYIGLAVEMVLVVVPMVSIYPLNALPIPSILVQADPKLTADRLIEQGNQAYRAEQFEAAIAFWQQAQTQYQQLQNREGEGLALANLGATYVVMERYQDAIVTLEAYLPIARSLTNRQGEAQSLGNLGIAYKQLGNYDQAVKLHQQAGKILWSLGDRQGVGKVLLNLGNAYESLGDYDKATAAYQQSLKIAQQTSDPTGESIALSNVGQVYTNLGNYDDAIAAHEKSLAIAQSARNPSAQASTLINLGSVYHARGDREKAIDYYKQSLTIAQTLPSRKVEGEALGSLGLAYEDLKNYPQSIQHYQQSLAIAHRLNDPAAQAVAFNNLGHALFGAGKLAEAETTLRSAVKLLDALRPGLSDTYKVSIFDTQIHTYNLLQQILIAANKPEAALEATEQGRARAFVELLSKRLHHQQVKANNQLPSLQSITVAQIKQVAQQQNATLVEYAIVPDDDFKFRGKQRGRGAELFIWVVQPTGQIKFRRVDLKPLWKQGATLDDVVRLSRCLVPSKDCVVLAQTIRGIGVVSTTDQVTSSTEASENPRVSKRPGLRKLHELLIQPIVDLLPRNSTDRIIFIPQESLFLVPFAALQNSDGQYLIEQYTILTAPAIQVLQLTREQRLRQAANHKSEVPSTTHSLIVGNPTMPKVALQPEQLPQPLAPLPGAEREAVEIAKLLNTTAITGDQATKAIVLQKLLQAKLVHLATHGLLSWRGSDVPGAIALAPTNSDDGLLTTSEILNLPEIFNQSLNAELVVLSACDTGQGTITGDGVIGLSRAFILAGAPSVVVSLWSIPDAPTAKLMTTFYQTLQKQPDKAQALRQAMLTTMKDYPRPIDWAAFLLIGEAE